MKIKAILMSLILSLCLVGVATAEEDLVYEISFKISASNKITFEKIKLDQGSPTEETPDSDYKLQVLSESGKVISTTYFMAEFEAWADPIDPENAFPFPEEKSDIGKFGDVKLTEMDIVLKAPYSEDAASFKILKDAKVLYTKKISLCNKDSECSIEDSENFLSCPDDCPSGSEDDYCDGIFDNICDSDCKSTGRATADSDCTCGNGKCDGKEDKFYCPADCGQPMNTFLIGSIVGIAVILLLIIALLKYVFGKKKKKSNNKSKKKD